jgi:hypothetical protein
LKIRISVEKGHATADAIHRMRDRLDKAVKQATSDALYMVERKAIANTYIVFRHPTGRLAGSFRIEPVRRSDGGWTGRVGPTVIYSRIQELGGEIFPKRAKFLHWVDETGSHFARHVTIRKHPYLKPAAEEVKGTLSDLYRARLTAALSE